MKHRHVGNRGDLATLVNAWICGHCSIMVCDNQRVEEFLDLHLYGVKRSNGNPYFLRSGFTISSKRLVNSAPSGVSSRENLAIRQKEAKRRTIAMTIDAVSHSEMDWHAMDWRKVY